MRRFHLAFLLVTPLMFSLSGCGKNSLTIEEFQQKSNDICDRAIVNIGFLMSGHSFDGNDLSEMSDSEIQENFEQVISFARGYVADILELGAPKEIASKVEQLMAEIDAATTELEQNGPDAMFASGEDLFAKYNSQFRSRLDELGLTCYN